MTSILKMGVVGLVGVLLIAWMLSASAALRLPKLAVTIPAVNMDASNHAQNKHGWLEAQLIIDCLGKSGPHMGLRFKGIRDGRFYIPCSLPDGRIGLAIFDKDGNNITAYVPKDGTWSQVREYILSRATRFTGALKWLQTGGK